MGFRSEVDSIVCAGRQRPSGTNCDVSSQQSGGGRRQGDKRVATAPTESAASALSMVVALQLDPEPHPLRMQFWDVRIGIITGLK